MTLEKLLNNAEWLRTKTSVSCLPMKLLKCKQSWNARANLEEFKWRTHHFITISLHLNLIFFFRFSWPTAELHWLFIEMIKEKGLTISLNLMSWTKWKMFFDNKIVNINFILFNQFWCPITNSCLVYIEMHKHRKRLTFFELQGKGICSLITIL